MKKFLTIFLYLLLALTYLAARNLDETYSVLSQQGYTDIQITGYNPFACSEDDLFRTSFTAKNNNGKTIKGVACGGLLKGTTIRFF